jgi:hypothetical protein
MNGWMDGWVQKYSDVLECETTRIECSEFMGKDETLLRISTLFIIVVIISRLSQKYVEKLSVRRVCFM